MVVPPKHPNMIIFSRKTPKLLGTSILGNPHFWNLWPNTLGKSFWADRIIELQPKSWGFCGCGFFLKIRFSFGSLSISRWWNFKHFIFSPLVGEMIQFYSYFSNGLKPPTRFDLKEISSRVILVVEEGFPKVEHNDRSCARSPISSSIFLSVFG